MPRFPRQPFTIVELTGCARCGGTHREIKFKPFTRRPAPVRGEEFGSPMRTTTHFGTCPKTKEPILLDSVRT